MYSLKQFANGFSYLEVSNDAVDAKIALQGAHIFDYRRKGEEPLLWLSEASYFENGKSIRGGIPICWPSFGMQNPNLPQHGFVRTMLWEFVSCVEVDTSTSEVILELKDSQKTREIWDYSFSLKLKITVSIHLKLELTTVNTGSKDFTLTQALHTYFNVSHINDVKIQGLENKPYLETLHNSNLIQSCEIEFSGEVDSVYQKVDTDIFLIDKKRTITLQNEGSSSVVVWNPWIEKTKRMTAMKEDDYLEFVCIETANAFEDARTIKVLESHTIGVSIS